MDSRANEALRIEWNERPIVRVEATVMIRGEVGWTPYLGAGYSKVAIYENVMHSEYRLYAYRIQDKVITLDSLIPYHMPFTKANAIFHHWMIGSQRMGLAFNGTADARSFDRGIRVALENLDKVAASNLSCGSSTASDDPLSTSPGGSPLPTSASDKGDEQSARFKKQSTSSHTSTSSSSSRHPAKPHCCRSLSTLPVQQYRQQTLSASSWQHTTTSSAPSSRPARRHSSSVPGRAHRTPSTSSHVVGPTQPPVTEPPQRPPAPAPTQSFTFPQVDISDELKKDPEKSTHPSNDVISNGRRAVTPSRRHRSRHRQDSGARARRTKTPNLDHLERQRDLQPTKPNSYVQITSSKPTGSHRKRSSDEHTVKYPGYRYSTPSRSVPYYSGGDYFFNTEKSFDGQSPEHHGGKSLLYQKSPTFSYTEHQKNLRQSSIINKAGCEEKRKGKHKEDLGERSKCRYCQTMFNHDKNRPGSCTAAPEDAYEVCINHVSCISCAGSTLKRCLPDTQIDLPDQPCTRGSRWIHWLLLGLISIFVPCLCLYPLLKSCHKCGVWCHCCGGRHESSVPQRSSSPNSALPGRH
uniref:Sprouty-related, EVH1 domain-containing protein 2-like n=1 Tax=Phallusia mammillata TaxID=59560 RepID=A0A6F9DTS3_9ASCI|nr:sprouty-related, EVH1 domain-containing protein 2-like [Phallusia mammillata]